MDTSRLCTAGVLECARVHEELYVRNLGLVHAQTVHRLCMLAFLAALNVQLRARSRGRSLGFENPPFGLFHH